MFVWLGVGGSALQSLQGCRLCGSMLWVELWVESREASVRGVRSVVAAEYVVVESCVDR